jgi:hypothetical protein
MKLGRLVAVVATVGLGVLGGPAAAQGQTGDSVTGTATFDTDIVGPVTFIFDAHSGPNGENPTGTVTNPALGIGPLPVNCLAVSGNRAVIGVSIDALIVVDNGSPGAGLDTVASPDVPVASCTDPPPIALGPFTAISGDVVVHDAQPFPTSKDQCKNGGWRNYPGFKNQGQCVAFVLKTRLCKFLERFGHHPRFCPARPPTR